jgi:hypothetical protein
MGLQLLNHVEDVGLAFPLDFEDRKKSLSKMVVLQLEEAPLNTNNTTNDNTVSKYDRTRGSQEGV